MAKVDEELRDLSHVMEEGTSSQYNNPPPEATANIFSFLSYWWVNKIIALGYQRPLEQNDLWDLMDKDRVQTVHTKFQENWRNEEVRSADQGKKPSLWRSLLQTIARDFYWAALPKLTNDIGVFTGPVLINYIILFAQDPDQPLWFGILLACGFLVSSLIIVLSINSYYHLSYRACLHTRSLLIRAIYGKCFKLNAASRGDQNIGQIVNLMAIDAEKVAMVMPWAHMLWSSPLQIIVALTMLINYLGVAALAGLATMVIMMPIQIYFAKRLGTLRKSQMLLMDKRVKLTNEVLQGIKIIKMYAWEPPFVEKLLGARETELKELIKQYYTRIGQGVLMAISSVIVAVTSFAVYVLISDKPLDAVTAFTSLSLFNLLSFPLNVMPMIVGGAIQAVVSLRRIHSFLLLDEIDDRAIHKNTGPLGAVKIVDATFSWPSSESDEKKSGEKQVRDSNNEQDEFPLHLSDLNVEICPGELTVVIGAVGSGKSSLMSAILGEMLNHKGQVEINGSVAYTTQQAWVLNATVKENITFGLPFDEKKYRQTITACALEEDLKTLLHGDETEIGEKGINLSGGQKQRIGLARAVYSDTDIYCMDDPLSAVDSHVGRHLFEECIAGQLKGKTRILCTNNLHFLSTPHINKIIVLQEGKIREQGTYDFLMKQGEAFSQLIKTFTEQAQDESSEELSDDEKDDETELIISHSKDDVSDHKQDNEEDEVEGMTRSRSRRKSSAYRKRVKSDCQKEEEQIQLQLEKKKQESMIAKKDLTEKEERITGAVRTREISAYIRALGGYFLFSFILLLFAVTQGSIVGADYWLSFWVSDLEQNPGARDLWFYLVIYCSFMLGSAFFGMVRGIGWTIGNYRASKNMHDNMLVRVLRAPMEFFETNPIGRILNRFSKDTDAIDTQLPMDVQSLLRCGFIVLYVLLVISLITPWFLAPLGPIAVMYYMVSLYYRPTSREIQRLDSISRTPIYNLFSETLGGTATIRAYGKCEQFLMKNEQAVDHNQRAFYAKNSANRWLDFRLQGVGASIIFCAALLAVFAKGTGIDAGLIGLSITMASRVTMNLTWFVRMTAACEADFNAIERVMHYVSLESEAPPIIDEHRPPKGWPDAGAVTFEKVSLKYREGLPLAMDCVSCDIKPGEKIGIVGRTGSGKSTTLAAFLRLIEPCHGTIKVDGLDISTIGLEDLRSSLTIIPQDPVMFSGTIRYNLDPFTKYTDDELWHALDNVQLTEAVREMNGLQAAVQEYGENLSVGQRQLLCLARALLRRSRVMMLDEATAAVDVETDHMVQETIRREFTDCTLLIIAHRLNTIIDADRILLMDKGKVIEFDTPKNLVSNPNSEFSKLLGTGPAADKLRNIALEGK